MQKIGELTFWGIPKTTSSMEDPLGLGEGIYRLNKVKSPNIRFFNYFILLIKFGSLKTADSALSIWRSDPDPIKQ